MNQVLPKGARKGNQIPVTNAETNDTVAEVALQSDTAAPHKTPAQKTASRKKRPAQGQKTAPRAKSNQSARTQKSARSAKPRAESKGARILAMIGRSQGATLAEIQKATGWQAHSVRGFLSTAGKRHGIQIQSTKGESSDRVYQITK